MPDLSGAYGREMDAAVARAQKLAEGGDAEGARSAYLKAAELALRLAQGTSSPAIKKQRLECAQALKAKADAVTKKPARVQEAKQTASGSEEGDADREQVRRLITKSTVRWDDIAGLDEVKRDLRTAYAMAVAKAPDGVKLSPSRTVLLYGPPGTGKTLLAAAVSTSLDATFFNIKTGDLLSSLFGKSPQLIAAVFDEAAQRAPAVLFFDEIEALTPSRDREISAAESRVLTAFLQALGGFTSKSDAPFVLTIGATNAPWQLDQAMLSRFARMVYVPLPDPECRARIFELNLGKRGIRSQLSARELADLADGYSGREITQLCEQAVAAAIRDSNPDLERRVDAGKDALDDYVLRLDRIGADQFRDALKKIHPVSTAASLRRYAEWSERQGG